MLKRLNIYQGIHITVIILIVMIIPRLIHLEDFDLHGTLIFIGSTGVHNMVIWVVCQYFLTHKCISKNSLKVLLAIIFGTIISTLIQIISSYLFPFETENAHLWLSTLTKQQQLLMYLFRGSSFTGLIYFIAYNISLTGEKQKNKIEIERLKQENLEARLSLLKQQISPHFLFNSLSTLKTIAPDNKTKNYVIQLANVYRYLLNNKDYQNQNLVSVTEELTFTKSYLYILTERFEEALQISIEVDKDQMGKFLPPLALQILIENAIKHNIVSMDEPLNIRIYNEGAEWLVVENNLQLKVSTEDSLGLGLQNIKDRYKILKNKDISILQTAESFIVKIPLLN
ncbi:MAG: histidine kinase [Paludibacteraceae bacterium]|nr:histidine kinase [Paludibacteraceae bacterium]